MKKAGNDPEDYNITPVEGGFVGSTPPGPAREPQEAQAEEKATIDTQIPAVDSEAVAAGPVGGEVTSPEYNAAKAAIKRAGHSLEDYETLPVEGGFEGGPVHDITSGTPGGQEKGPIEASTVLSKKKPPTIASDADVPEVASIGGKEGEEGGDR